MPERKQITWAQLRVGLMVIASVTIFGVGVFFISGRVGFWSPRYALKAYFSDAGGLREGAQVQLAGVVVGNVDQVVISPFSDPARAVQVGMRIVRDYQSQIRADSEATIVTAGLLGEKYVDITRGTPGAAAVPDNGEVKSREEADIKRIVQNTNDVILNLRVLSSKLNDVGTQIQSGKGSLGRLIYDETFYTRVNATAAGVERLVAGVERGEGTVGKLMSDETLYKRALDAVEHISQVVDDLQHGQGSLPKFISDPGVYNGVRDVVAKTNTMIDNINKGQGTLGKLAIDPQLYDRLNDTVDHVNTVTTRIDHGQGTLGKLSTDPTLYNNLSESSQSLREFLTEFRQNPKKYLSIRVRLF